MEFAKRIIRFLKNLKYYIPTYIAVRKLITPFSPYLICKYHFSNEIRNARVKWINLRSKDLSKHIKKVKHQDWIYCDIDLIPEFVNVLLPQIKNSFVLFTGKWHLPGLEESEYTSQLLQSEKLIKWFSHNMCIAHPKCHPFPYGICHTSVSQVHREMKKSNRTRKKEIYVGHMGIHAHLSSDIKASRTILMKRVDKWLPLPEYLQKLHEYCFVISPQGDRSDTYRHWEAIALGCIPISDVPDSYKELFGDNMRYVENMEDSLELTFDDLFYTSPDSRIATIPYWVKKAKQLTN